MEGNSDKHRPAVEDNDTDEKDFNDITNFCDCTDKGRCLLSNQSYDYLNILKMRKTVPAVSDLDISDVCRELYGK